MNELSTVTTTNTVYFSGKASSHEERKALFNATANPDKKLKECINFPIAMVNVYAEPIEVTDEEGKTSTAPRIIIFDADGTSYSCVSVGIYNTLVRLFATFGEPSTWDEPLVVIPKLISRGTDRNILTLEVK